MGRPAKETVDYFPHFVKGGRTIFILEKEFGNDGYAFWFKLLELLGDSDGHYYDCSIPGNWVYLLAKTGCDEVLANGIIKTLLTLGKIDNNLWENRRVIWCNKLVDNVSSVYKMRRTEPPTPPSSFQENSSPLEVSVKENGNGLASVGLKTDIVEYSKEKNSKGEKKEYPYKDICNLWNSICTSLPKVIKLTDERKQKIKSRLNDFGVSEEEYLAACEDIFRRIQSSDFLTGNQTEWKASFDWLFDSRKNWIKIKEGNYDNNKLPHRNETAHERKRRESEEGRRYAAARFAELQAARESGEPLPEEDFRASDYI